MRAPPLRRLRGRVQTMHGLRRTVSTGLFANATVVVEVGVIHVSPRVIKMQADRVKANLKRLDSRVDQSLAQLTVFSAIAHPFVKTSCLDNVTRPARRIVPIPCRARGCQRVQKRRGLGACGEPQQPM